MASPDEPRFADMLGATTLRGAAHELTAATCARLGRAFGTCLHRRGFARAVVVIGRVGDVAGPVRDGFVRGLVMSGHDVKDGGVLPREALAVAAAALNASAQALLARGDDDTTAFSFVVDGAPLMGRSLDDLAALADGDIFASGEGTLELVPKTRLGRELSPRG
jgi:hypothetical protein